MSKFIMKMSKVIRKVGRVDEKLEELEIIPTLPILELELAEQFKHWQSLSLILRFVPCPLHTSISNL